MQSKNEEEDTEQEKNEIQSKSNYHYATYNKYDDEEKEQEFPRMTEKWLNKFLCSNYKLYYRTHELNDCLYLHFKGFKILENLDTFINLKVLYLEGNAIKKIQGLDKLVNLVSLYLHQNLIEKIENLENLKSLYNLNLSDNCISKIENLGELSGLNNLLLKGNRIGMNGMEDLSGLSELKTVTVIDVSENRIEAPEVKDLLKEIPTLRVVYLQGNGCIRKISHYRKVIISLCKELRYLDDKPVFEDERIFAEAFAKGGLDEEKKARENYKKEKQEAELQRINDFREMVAGWRGEKVEEIVSKENEEEKLEKEKEREEQKKKLLMKCQNKSNSGGNKMEIKEENIDVEKFEDKSKKTFMTMTESNVKNSNEIFDDNYDLPNLEAVKIKKDEGYIDYILEKDKYNKDNMIEAEVDTKFPQEEKNELSNLNTNKNENSTTKLEIKEHQFDELD